MKNDIAAEVKGPLQVGRHEGIVHDGEQAAALRQGDGGAQVL